MGKETRSQRNDKRWAKKEKKRLKKIRKKNRKWYVKLSTGLSKFIGVCTLMSVFVVLGAAGWFWNKEGESISKNIAEGFRIAKTIDAAQFDKLDPTQLLDGDGTVIREFKERNFTYLNLKEDDDLFDKVSDVVVSIEDERFYDHKGFDYYAVGTALYGYAKGNDLRGASTITQQVVKNTYLTQEQTTSRKIQEAVIAQELEKKFSKREILEFYVNQNYYANGQYGLATASNYYYGKPVAELTNGELAVLTGIPNNPTVYDPVRNPDNATKKRNVILLKMRQLEKISEKEYEEEKNKPLELAINKIPIDNSVNDYAQSLAVHEAVEALMEETGFAFEYWFDTDESHSAYKSAYDDRYLQVREDILRGGYKIETSIDQEKQAILQKAVDDQMSIYKHKNPETGLYKKQASAVTIDNRTNEVVAIVGGRSQEGNHYNRAYLGARQPASAIKPFVAYAPAFEKGKLPQNTMTDKALKGGPTNWYDGYRGSVTLRYALEQSINTVAYQLVQDVGGDVAAKKMVDMEFASLRPHDNNPIISIGGFTIGTTPLELTRGLNTLVNEGNYFRSSSLRKITHLHTEEVLVDLSEREAKPVYEPEASYMTLDVMKGVVNNGTGKASNWGYKNIAGKTGTSNGRKDLWFIGATPHYSTSVWVGEDTPAPQPFAVASTPPAIFKQAMQTLHKGLPDKDFVMPANVTRDSNGSFAVLKKIKAKGNTKQLDRINAEGKRKKQESQTLRSRLSDLDYRLIHGLSWEEEEKRENIAKSRIESLEGAILGSPEQFGNIQALYDDAMGSLMNVKRESAKKELIKQLERAFSAKLGEKRTVEKQREEEARRKKEEEERLKQREIQQRREEERREEERLERELKEESRREEAELNNRLNQGQSSDNYSDDNENDDEEMEYMEEDIEVGEVGG